MNLRPRRNVRLEATIIEAGVSYAALAAHVRAVAAENGDRSVRTNSSAVTHWVNSTLPRPATVAYLVEALARLLGRPITAADVGLCSPGPEMQPDPVKGLAELGRLDVQRRQFLAVFSLPLVAAAVGDPAELTGRARVAAGRGIIGNAEVEVVRTVVDTFTKADERLGGGAGRTAVAEYLASDATAYLQGRFANGRVRAQMHAAVAELARLAGWTAYDAGHSGLAQRYYVYARQLAAESEPGHTAFIMRLMAHQGIDLGHGRACIDLAEAAVTTGRGRVDSATLGQLHLAAARTHAAAGDGRAARAALTIAERCMTHPVDDADRPWWALAMGTPGPLLATHTAKALRDLSDPAVARHLQTSADRWNPATHPRVRALNLVDLGGYHAQRGSLEHACGAWSEALQLLDGVSSARARTAVTGIRAALTPYRRRGGSEVGRIDTAAARWLAAHH
ncbi:tetratricopeptide repeat protein [Actinomadura sp. 3N508]|uniref:tetratricopeptide repeat protein n=1 Tax=Actinomadura sp. 3N508 TaxID=3375153 RepID=UPI00379FEBEA